MMTFREQNRLFLSPHNLLRPSYKFLHLVRFVVALNFLGNTLIAPTSVYAQQLLNLPNPGTMVSRSPGFTPIILKGVKIFPWVVPEKAQVYQQNERAFVVGTHLKVMLEEDYLSSNVGRRV